MAEYVCEYCQLPITQERIEIAYIDSRLILFHPMRCKMFTEGTNCVLEYFSDKEEIMDLLSTTIEDLEQTTEAEIIRLLKERIAETNKRTA